jgi:hypothetical protein
MKCLLARALPLLPPRPCASTHGRAWDAGRCMLPHAWSGVSANELAETNEQVDPSNPAAKEITAN